MSNELNRRSFMKTAGTSAAAVLGGTPALSEASATCDKTTAKQIDSSSSSGSTREFNGSYGGENLSQIAFPMGGIGAGMMCLDGTGSISQVSIKNRPNLSNEPGMFAAISVEHDGKRIAKVVEGPVPERKIFGSDQARRGGATQKSGQYANYGLPRFDSAKFSGCFPLGHVVLHDDDLPVVARVTGWSPFIPGDEDSSSLPVLGMEYRFSNRSEHAVSAVFSFHTPNFLSNYEDSEDASVTPIDGGFMLANMEDKDLPCHLAISAPFNKTSVNGYYRGGWFDSRTLAWKDVERGIHPKEIFIPTLQAPPYLYHCFCCRAKSLRFHYLWPGMCRVLKWAIQIRTCLPLWMTICATTVAWIRFWI